MLESLLEMLKTMPKEVVTLILATLPIAELRFAIPWALAAAPAGGGLTWPTAYLWAVIGNFIPV